MKKMVAVFAVLLTLILSNKALAAEMESIYLEGTIREVKVEKIETEGAQLQIQKIIVDVTRGTLQNKQIKVENSDINKTYSVNDNVTIIGTQNQDGQIRYFIEDDLRVDKIAILFFIFLAVVIAVSKKAGIASVVGMTYSFIIILKVMLPLILSGISPIVASLIAVIIITPVTFVLSHGYNKKTAVALIGTFISLMITTALAMIFINGTKLSGFGTEEAYFIKLAATEINVQGLLLAGIIIGTLGILDDATVTQAGIVYQLKSSIRNLTIKESYKKAMEIGHDHIASTVNTLILVYTGASISLFLLFVNSNRAFRQVLNNQIIAEEIVAMLVSSIGLIVSIPITTSLAAHIISGREEISHSHQHHH